MNNCNNCTKFLTCNRGECSQVTYLQSGQIDRVKAKEDETMTKYYVKDIYKKDKLIKTIFVILITFLVGMYVGVAINYLELQEKDSKIREQYVEIDSLRETVYQYELEEKRDV